MEVALDGPLDVAASAGVLAGWGDDLLDRFVDGTMVRTADGVPFVARPLGTVAEPCLDVEPASMAERARTMFQQREAALAALAGEDAVVAGLVARFPGLRPLRSLEPLFSLVRSVSAQQVNLTFAARLRRRLAEELGTPLEVAGHAVRWLDPERLARTDPAQLRAMQFTNAKAATIVGLAQAMVDGRLVPTELEELADDEVIARLTAFKGIGRWSAEWYLVRTLGRPRVVAGDLMVRKAVGRLYADGTMPSEEETRRLTAHWGDAAAIAQQLALRWVVVQSGRVTAP